MLRSRVLARYVRQAAFQIVSARWRGGVAALCGFAPPSLDRRVQIAMAYSQAQQLPPIFRQTEFARAQGRPDQCNRVQRASLLSGGATCLRPVTPALSFIRPSLTKPGRARWGGRLVRPAPPEVA